MVYDMGSNIMVDIINQSIVPIKSCKTTPKINSIPFHGTMVVFLHDHDDAGK